MQRRLFYEPGTFFIQAELDATGEPPIAPVAIKTGKPAWSTESLVKTNKDWKNYKDDYLAWWADTSASTPDTPPIDALLLPTCGSAGFPHDHTP